MGRWIVSKHTPSPAGPWCGFGCKLPGLCVFGLPGPVLGAPFVSGSRETGREARAGLCALKGGEYRSIPALREFPS